MKLANIVIAVIILGLAGTSIYYANRLHQKRYEVKARGDILRERSVALVKDYDALINSAFLNDFPEAALRHGAGSSKVGSVLPKLQEQFTAFADYRAQCVQQMNAMAETMSLKPGYFNEEDANSEAGISVILDKFPKGGDMVKKRDELIFKGVEETAERLAVNGVTAESLAGVKEDEMAVVADNFASMNSNVGKMFSRLAMYESKLVEIARLFDDGDTRYSNIDFGDKNISTGPYEEKCGLLCDRVASVEPQLLNLNNKISAKDARIAEQTEEIAGLQNQNDALAAELSRKENITSKIQKIIESTEPPPPKQWNSDDEEITLQAVEAKILAIEPEMKFVIVDFGSNSTVTQPGTEKVAADGTVDAHKALVKLPKGAFTMVVQKADGSQLKGRVKIARVEPAYTVANIETIQSLTKDGVAVVPETGDVVFFLPDTIDDIVKSISKDVATARPASVENDESEE